MREEELLGKWFHLSDIGSVEKLARASQIVQIKKNNLLIESGETQTQLPILISGVFRGFLLDADGRDTTDCFVYQSGEIVMGCNPLGEASQINMEAMVDSEVMLVLLSTLLPLMDSCPELLRLYNRYLTEALECSAMQRYQWFLKNYPGLIHTLSNKHIAWFLGMTPVTLSRLRRQLRKPEKVARAYP